MFKGEEICKYLYCQTIIIFSTHGIDWPVERIKTGIGEVLRLRPYMTSSYISPSVHVELCATASSKET